MSGMITLPTGVALDTWNDILSSGLPVALTDVDGGTAFTSGVAGLFVAAFCVAGVFSLKRRKPKGSADQSDGKNQSTGRNQPKKRSNLDDNSAGWNSLARGQAAVSVIDELQERLSQAFSDSDDNESRWLFNSVADGLCVSDSHGRISRANPAFLSILDLEEANEQHIGDMFAGLSAESAEEIRERLQRGATSFVCEVHSGEDSDRLVLRLSCSPLLNEEGEQRGLVWCLRDITQLKLAEEMRNEFVYTATHELRTPLANLRSYAETLTLEDGIDVEQQKQFCNIINSEATRLTRFVDELLDVSQMEGGALTVTRSPIDVTRLVEDVVAHVQPDISRREQEFEYQPPPKMPKLSGDKDKLAAALVNLLGNASKYSLEGGHVGLQIELDETNIRFHIDDTGFGISEEEQGRIFDKFFRSGDERVLAESGNGLGLAYTQQVARLHGGRVTVKSELNRGSRFTLTLPLK